MRVIMRFITRTVIFIITLIITRTIMFIITLIITRITMLTVMRVITRIIMFIIMHIISLMPTRVSGEEEAVGCCSRDGYGGGGGGVGQADCSKRVHAGAVT